MFHKDYIMRLISEIIRALLKLLFNMDEVKKEELLILKAILQPKLDSFLWDEKGE